MLPTKQHTHKKAGLTAGGTLQLDSPKPRSIDFVVGITTASVTTFPAVATDYTYSDGVFTCVTDQSAKTLLIFGQV